MTEKSFECKYVTIWTATCFRYDTKCEWCHFVANTTRIIRAQFKYYSHFLVGHCCCCCFCWTVLFELSEFRVVLVFWLQREKKKEQIFRELKFTLKTFLYDFLPPLNSTCVCATMRSFTLNWISVSHFFSFSPWYWKQNWLRPLN